MRTSQRPPHQHMHAAPGTARPLPHMEAWNPFGGSSKKEELRAETERVGAETQRIREDLGSFKQMYDARLSQMAASFESQLHSFETKMTEALDRTARQVEDAQSAYRSYRQDVNNLSDSLNAALAKHQALTAEIARLSDCISATQSNLRDLVSILIQNDQQLRPILNRFSKDSPPDSLYADPAPYATASYNPERYADP